FLLRVPLNRNFMQLYPNRNAIDVDITKEVRLAIRRPDPNRYNLRPLGLPSGVRIYGMTFRRSGVRMTVTGRERDQVFVAPDVPSFAIALDRVTRGNYQVEARVTDPYGNETVFETEWQTLANGQKNVVFHLPLPLATNGCHQAEIRLMGGKPERKSVILRHATTLALLPHAERQYHADNPFGTWDFWGGHFTPNDMSLMGPAYQKMGLRYTLAARGDPELLKPYGLVEGRDERAHIGAAGLTNLVAAFRAKGPEAYPPTAMIFHENAISGAHISRTPDVFTGAAPYVFDEKEQKRFDEMWAQALHAAKMIRREFPKTEIYFGNGNPHLMEEFLRRKFPAELFGSRGNECGSFARPPETQPLNWVANNAGLFMDRTILDHYGYTNTPLRQNFEITYPGTNPGNLTLDTQANYFIRHAVHSLAWGIPRIRIGMMTDVGNSYYYSNWGASGFMFAQPKVSPKPSYVAMATMIRELDGAVFSRIVEVVDAPAVYIAEFKRRAGGAVCVAWTPRGTRPIAIATGGRPLRVTDKAGNSLAVAAVDGSCALELGPAPIFIRSEAPLGAVRAGAPVHAITPPDAAVYRTVAALDTLDGWRVDPAGDTQLDIYNHKEPRRKGAFNYAVTGAAENQPAAIRVTPTFPVAGSAFLPAYSILRHADGIPLPDKPTEIGLMVNGNAGFGRVIFELTDASGQLWRSIGASARGDKPNRWLEDWMGKEEASKLKGAFQSDWNTNDMWGRSAINFEGWRFLTFPLPGNYPGEGYHWPYSSQWYYDGDGTVHYPLTLRALIFTAPENVLKFTRYAPPADYAFEVRDLRVGQRPVEAIGAE
ncbi:MAG: hypothetical protein RBS99_13605, partial [Rhodospirillales bacterium]|nr:hypothetical protein [Rhodospirillales bacterium]